MKRKLLLLMLLISGLVNAQNQIESAIYEYYDSTTSTYQNSGGYNYQYDSSNNLISEANFSWNSENNNWELQDKTTYTYNSNNKVTERLYQQWNSDTNQFVNYYKETNTYNANNNLVQSTNQDWNGSQWINTYQISISYNGNNLNVATFLDWNGTAWVNDEKSTVTYVGNNISQFLNEEWTGSQWNVTSRDLLTYNANNKIILSESEDWVNGIWIPEYQTSFVINAAGNRVQEIDTEMGYNYKNDYTYDTSALLSSFAHPFKDKTGIDYLVESFPYVNKILSSIESSFDDNTNQYILAGRTTYNYLNALATKDIISQNRDKITLYPNPTHSILNIQIDKTIEEVSIIDISGRTTNVKLAANNTIDVNTLSSGIYFIMIKTTEGFYREKFIKN